MRRLPALLWCHLHFDSASDDAIKLLLPRTIAVCGNLENIPFLVVQSKGQP